MPYTVHGLGVARFGVLSLAWILIGYLSLFDLGLGRATIRFVADAVGREEGHQIPRVVWTSAAIQFSSGVVGGLAVAALANVLVPGVIKVPADLVPEARTVIVLLGLGLPILVVTTGFKGVLEAHQRFDLVNIVRSTGGVLMFGIPAAGCSSGAPSSSGWLPSPTSRLTWWWRPASAARSASIATWSSRSSFSAAG